MQAKVLTKNINILRWSGVCTRLAGHVVVEPDITV